MSDFLEQESNPLNTKQQQELQQMNQNTDSTQSQDYPQYDIECDLENQNKDNEQDYYYDNQNSTSLFSAPEKIRNNFIKKVYGIISVQLIFTAIMIYYSVHSWEFAKLLQESTSLSLLSFIAIIGSQITLLCFRGQARKVPNNYIILSIFTIGFSYLTSIICSSYAWTSDGQPDYDGQRLIWIAACITAGVTLALTVYAFTTSKDYTTMGGMLFVSIFGLVILGLLAFLTQIQILYTLYLWIGVTVYGLYLVYDTQLLCENKEKNLQIDDYIIGAMIIYVDILQLFIKILRILAESQKK